MSGRWIKFSFVGAAGLALQLGALWVLRHKLGLHYLVATLFATELAILLNFACHESWTWSDRGGGNVIRRLFRFHVANGAISLAGAALIMPLLVDIARLHYLIANVVTVACCGIANFVAADRVVFSSEFDRTPPSVSQMTALTLALCAWCTPVMAADLGPDTLDAFNRYVRVTEARMNRELRGQAPFLWVDQLSESARRQAIARLDDGEVVIDRLLTREANREIEAPHGLIHHWTGTVFIQGASVDRVVRLMQDYEAYQRIYSPHVRRSRTVGRQGQAFNVFLQLFVKKVISVVLNTEYDVTYLRLSATRMHVRSYSTRIAEVQHAGASDETEAPAGQESGFLWRLNNYCSIDERQGGAYVQCESLSLSRGVPTGLGWLVGPFVTSIPRESLEFTLGGMRKALRYSGA